MTVRSLQNALTPTSTYRRAAAVVIAASRHEANLTQDELSKILGWCRSKIAKIESGERRVEFPDIFSIAHGLQIDPVLLMIRVQQWVLAPSLLNLYLAGNAQWQPNAMPSAAAGFNLISRMPRVPSADCDVKSDPGM